VQDDHREDRASARSLEDWAGFHLFSWPEALRAPFLAQAIATVFGLSKTARSGTRRLAGIPSLRGREVADRRCEDHRPRLDDVAVSPSRAS
jgi:hypothetical protein